MSDSNGSKMKIKICQTVGTIRKSRKTKNMPHCQNNSKIQKNKKYTTLSEQFENLEKQRIYHTVETIQKQKYTTLSEQFKIKNIPHCRNNSNIQQNIVDKEKIDTPNTQIHDCSVPWLDTDTSIKSGGVKLVI